MQLVLRPLIVSCLLATTISASANASLRSCPKNFDGKFRFERSDSLRWKPDKRAHFTAEFVIGSLVEISDRRYDLRLSYVEKVATSSIFGLAVEAKDGFCNSGFSHGDMAYNIAGATAGVYITSLVTERFSDKRYAPIILPTYQRRSSPISGKDNVIGLTVIFPF